MKFIIGNWKMNGSLDEKETMLKTLKSVKTDNTIILCLPFTLIADNNHNINIGAQDVSQYNNGAYTGDISAEMLKQSGVKYVIVGHSERRIYHNETNKIVKAKATAAIKKGLVPIICVGETDEEKKSGRTMSAVKKMLLESIPNSGKYIIAYEPYWAIGTGKTASIEEISNVTLTISKALQHIGQESTPILYGGSINATNAKDIVSIPHCDGLLIGKASLKTDTFLPIIKSLN